MLNDSGWHAFELISEFPAPTVECLYFDIVVPFDIAIESGDAQAAFLADLLTLSLHNHGVYQGGWAHSFGIDDNKPLQDADLRRG